MELIDTIKKDLKETLSERRYIHSIGVMEMCAKLAQIYEVDVQKAQIAGLLHDIAKEMPKEEMFKYVEENNIEITEIEKISYQILHGKIGADIAKKKYDEKDYDFLIIMLFINLLCFTENLYLVPTINFLSLIMMSNIIKRLDKGECQNESNNINSNV